MFSHISTAFFINAIKYKRLVLPVRYYGATCDSPKIAVVLSGCGVYDGTEIHEAASVLSHITRNNAVPKCFAPKIKQMHVINHSNGEVDISHNRGVLEESARISRGDISSLCKLIETQSCYDAVVFPGGFGVAKNLSDYATRGIDCTIHPEVVQVLKDFHCAKKPIGLICIAPILAAKIFCNSKMTFGMSSCDKWPHRAIIEDAMKLGAIIEYREVNEVSFDEKNLIFSSPAFMYDGQYHEIDDGIGALIKYMLTYMMTQNKY